jgi:hypothetical protein
MMAAGGARAGGGDAGTAATRLAWTALGGSLLLVAVGVGLRELGPRAGVYPFWGEVTVMVVVLGTLGALVAARRPGHPVGWLFAGIGLAGAVQLVAGNYAMAARADPALPAAGPGDRRPPLRPGPLRRRRHGRAVRGPAAGPAQPGHLVLGAAGRGRPHRPASVELAVAAARESPARDGGRNDAGAVARYNPFPEEVP